MLTFQSEDWPNVAEEMKPLFREHWLEIGVDRDSIPLDPDIEMYDKFHSIGYLKITTVREDGRLIGYYMSIVSTHLHYRTSLFGFNDAYFILPEKRSASVGIRLFMEMEKSMRALGVKKLMSITKLGHNVSPLFEKLGWKPVETVFTKLLETE